MPYLVAPVMGTTVSIDVRDDAVPSPALEAAAQTLRDLEARFTTFRDDSEIKRIERGELTLAEAHPDIREVLGETDGPPIVWEHWDGAEWLGVRAQDDTHGLALPGMCGVLYPGVAAGTPPLARFGADGHVAMVAKSVVRPPSSARRRHRRSRP